VQLRSQVQLGSEGSEDGALEGTAPSVLERRVHGGSDGALPSSAWPADHVLDFNGVGSVGRPLRQLV